MNIRTIFNMDTMLIAVVLWICTLPLIAFLVAPIFGVKIAMLTALLLFALALLIRWNLCGREVYKD